ncbi:MAG: arylsulfatase [Planctomycetota bacterium]|nr:arylsulfatase [Planctomycetaceae bacterium]MDQ3330810.1 arylsulfatase [Planctomycetota bacterium]
MFFASFAADASRPNIVLILADDLGVGELGCYGQKIIKTPRLDRLASEGTLFTQHYSGFPVCAPARCTLMTGKHAGHSFIRDNGNPAGRQKDESRNFWPGQNPIPTDEVTVAELFKAQGYATGAMGKWGLGYEHSTGDPSQQGFDLFFGYLCQAHAHNHFPRFLWRITPAEHEQVFYPGNDRTLQGKTYSQDEFFREAEEFVRANQERPFFLYLPVIVTHLSIQVPEDEPSLAEYRRTIPEEPYEHKSNYLKHPTPRAGYAAMVTRMDREIGELLDLLESLELADDTIVVFTSDNGPTYNRLGGSDSDFFHSAMGRRGFKGSVYEGGIREPLIVRWKDRVADGTTSDLPTYFPDWLPTLLDLAGAAASIPDDVDGLSFAPTLLGKPQSQKKHDFLYWEFPAYGSQQAVRVGDWKAVRQNLAKLKPGEAPQTELYDLAADPGESRDVSADHPEVVEELEGIMASQHEPSEMFPLPGIDRMSRSKVRQAQ